MPERWSSPRGSGAGDSACVSRLLEAKHLTQHKQYVVIHAHFSGLITGSDGSCSSVSDLSNPAPFCLGPSKHEYENNYIAAFPNVFINNVCIQTKWESGNNCNCYFPPCPFSFLGLSPSLLVVWRLVISGGAGLFPRCHWNNARWHLLPRAEADWFNFTHWVD